MSHEIIKSIRIRDNKVFINSASNNVTPRYFMDCEAPYYTNILQTQGETALDCEILKTYEEYSFQPGTKNKYTTALSILKSFSEYAKFDWRNSKYGNDCEVNIARQSDAYTELLKRALNTKTPKEKMIVARPYTTAQGEIQIYLVKATRTGTRWGYSQKQAKVFRFKNEIDRLQQQATEKDNWNIININ